MEVVVMDREFRSIYLIDSFESLIWTERYGSCGDFELYTRVDQTLLSMALQDNYLWLKNSDQMMIIEEISIATDVETGAHMTVSGRSLESILDRRIIWNQTVLNGDLQNAIKQLIYENVINPSILERKIEGFIFEETDDPKITNLTIKAQYTGDNLYETIETICKAFGIGFQVTLREQTKEYTTIEDYINDPLQDSDGHDIGGRMLNGPFFVFKLYAGVDRSYDQEVNPYVIFSPKYENIINSNYLESKKTYKNVTLVAGEDQGSIRKTRIVGIGKDLDRREAYTDARDIQSETQDGTLTPDEYNAQLDQRGVEKLSENPIVKTFEGEVEATQIFVYGKDFFKGDILQNENEFGIEAKVRVIEIVRSQDQNGYQIYPTFEVVD